jgi:hypothetical protein
MASLWRHIAWGRAAFAMCARCFLAGTQGISPAKPEGSRARRGREHSPAAGSGNQLRLDDRRGPMAFGIGLHADWLPGWVIGQFLCALCRQAAPYRSAPTTLTTTLGNGFYDHNIGPCNELAVEPGRVSMVTKRVPSHWPTLSVRVFGSRPQRCKSDHGP